MGICVNLTRWFNLRRFEKWGPGLNHQTRSPKNLVPKVRYAIKIFSGIVLLIYIVCLYLSRQSDNKPSPKAEKP